MRRQRHRRTVVLAAPPIIGIILLAGCSGGGVSSGSSVSSPSGASAAGPAGAESAAAAHGTPPSGTSTSGDSDGGSSGGSAQTASQNIARAGADLIYTAQLSVRASSIAAAVTRATAIATAAGGYISSENDSSDPADTSQSSATLGLRIPVAVYPATLSQLDSGRLGTQVSLRQQAQDVTQQVADVGSQVTSDESAIAQLRTLLTHAGSVPDLLTVQNQINSEESSLESMLAQQKALDDETAYATVTVTVLGPMLTPAARKTKPKPPPGLASGLSGGWRVFRLSVDWLLAVVGAGAPFAVVAAVLVYLGYLLRRRFRSA
jgi:hypothetical protein